MKRAGIGLLAIVIVIAAAAVFGWRTFKKTVEPITDPAQYGEVIAKLREENCPLVSHLPATLPPSAAAISLFYEPKLMQGAERFRLRFTLPETEFKALVAEIAALPAVPSSEQMPGDPVIPSGFRKITLRYFADAPSGNNPSGHGMALCDATHEIIYWYEFW